ncbi:MAG: glycoside hydrolase family 3 N-terminal domain-containing protein, partial [Succinatimonas sp.]|nr:glycoside hydrolase family 3 N-terminal domain-containing protein [Succinatimonas sp.]
KMFFSILLCVILVITVMYHFQDEEEEDYTKYPELVGQIASVGDETLLIRLSDNTEYLISIAGVIDKNKGLLTGNTISIRYEGKLDKEYKDIQDIKVKKYQVTEKKIGNYKKAYVNQELSNIIQNMSLEEKIAQMFLVRCPDNNQEEFVKNFKPGGYLLFAKDFEDLSKEEVIHKIENYQKKSKIKMFIGVDEEGGSVVRISQYLRSTRFQSPQMIYSQGGYENIKEDTKEKNQFLKQFGINLNLAPVCDISTNSDDFMYSRSFGKDASETGKYVQTVVKQMNEDLMGGCLKHFPGYGNNNDSHYNVVHDTRSYKSIKENDLIPFQKGIEENANMILVCHNIIDNIDKTLPASLSKKVHHILRNDMTYNGIIITDDLVMEGVKKLDSNENNAIKAVAAGNDMLISSDAYAQYQTIVDAVKNNQISENQIDQSVLRILYYKQQLQII